ncbi:MAG TPA: protein kinase [Roseiflexaceae bacterium]|jgi:serine/threonine-protein kinase|nr:protein kinase [Roseiflexaceae bacterium]
MTDHLLNSYLGPYRLIEVLGRGGMATVYKAYQASLDRFVAIKVLQHPNNADYAARFKAEARSLALLQHPNILPVHDYGEQDGVFYLVLQYVEHGSSLADSVGEPFATSRALSLMARVLAGLEYAHSRGVVHRDIKPANILMPAPDWPMLADFGLSKMLSESSLQLTMPGTIMGTAAYMAPEQVTGQPIDARADVYAAGVVLYQLLTGRLPFEGDTPTEVLVKQAYMLPPSPREFNPSISEQLEQAVMRALAKNPADRFQSAAELAAALEQIAAHPEQDRSASQPPVPGVLAARPASSMPAPGGLQTARVSFETAQAAPPAAASEPQASMPVSAPPAPNKRRAPWMIPALAVVLIALIGSGAYFFWPRPSGPQTAEQANAAQVAALTTATAATSPTAAPATQAAPTAQPAAAVPASASGTVEWHDSALRNDSVTISVNGLPAPGTDEVYAAWLSNARGSLALGPLSPGTGGALSVNYVSPAHTNLVGEFDRMYITRVPKDTATAEVANVIMAGGLPNEPLTHIRHNLFHFDTTPGQIGFVLGLRQEVDEEILHAQLLKSALDAGKLNDAKTHAEHVVNIIEGQFGPDFGDLNHDGKTQNPGDGFGILQNGQQEGYMQGALHHVLLAASAPGAPASMQRLADNVKVFSESVNQRVGEIRDHALKVNAAKSADAARSDADAVLALSQQLLQGEGSILTIYQQIQQMASVPLAPVDPGSITNAPPPVQDTAAPPPDGVTVTLKGDAFNPRTLTVAQGATVVWKNDDDHAHTVTAEDGSFDSKVIPPGGTFQFTFTKAEIFAYYCTIHGAPHGEGMSGAVNVQAAAPTAQP